MQHHRSLTPLAALFGLALVVCTAWFLRPGLPGQAELSASEAGASAGREPARVELASAPGASTNERVAPDSARVAEPQAGARADAGPRDYGIDMDTQVLVSGRVVEFPVEGERSARRPGANLPINLKIGRVSIPATHTLTDDEGRFRFEIDWPKGNQFVYTLRIAGDEIFRKVRMQDFLTDRRRISPEHVLARVVDGRANGVVLDEEGEPLNGVEFTWETELPYGNRAEPVGGSLVSDLHGAWTIGEALAHPPRVKATPGYQVIEERLARPHSRGGWRAGQLVLRDLAGLRVRVVDGRGRALEGVTVSLRATTQRPRAKHQELISDADGLVEFRGLQRRAQLRVTAERELSRVSGTRHLNGKLLDASDEAGHPILIGEGWTLPLEVTLERGASLSVQCAQLGTSKASISVLYTVDGATQAMSSEARGDAPARFVLPRNLDSSEVWIAAKAGAYQERYVDEEHLSPRISGPSPASGAPEADSSLARAAWRRVFLEAGNVQTEVTLELEPALTISGVIHGAESARTHLRVVLAQAPGEPGWPYVKQSTTPLGSKRAFTLDGLARGTYSLIATNTRLGVGGSRVRLDNIPAGAQQVEIHLEQELSVEIELEPLANEALYPRAQVKVWRLADELAGAPPGAIENTLSSPDLWSKYLTIGSLSRMFDAGEGKRLPLAQPGTYVLLITPRSADGERCATVFSAPMRLRAGEHVLRYACIEAGRLSIRLPSEGFDDCQVELRTATGLAFPNFEVAGRITTRHARGKGRFLRLTRVPVGSYTLIAEVPRASGEALLIRTQDVEVRARETTSVKL